MSDTVNQNTAADELANREFTAIGGDQAAPGQDTTDAAPEVLSSAQIIGAALAAGREVFCLVAKLDSPRRHLDDSTCQHLGSLWGPVCDKHGIDLAKYMGDYAVEMAAIVGTFGVAMTLRQAVTAEIIAKRPVDTTAKPVEDGNESSL